MDHRFVLPLNLCTDPMVVGGKAAGLGRLIKSGFRVPSGLCLTTEAYREALRDAHIQDDSLWAHIRHASESTRSALLARCHQQILACTLPTTIHNELASEVQRVSQSHGHDRGMLWAVRSSAAHEDSAEASFAGLYRTSLGVPSHLIGSAIIECWASLWTPAAVAYHQRKIERSGAPAMAVVLQPLLSPRAAGVAYSCDPMTRRSDVVAINAVFGLAEPLVSGVVTPDEYVILIGEHKAGTVLQRHVAEKRTARVMTSSGLADKPILVSDQQKPALTDREMFKVAALAKEVERGLGHPVDLEWAIDSDGIWVLQARPIPSSPQAHIITAASCTWSRANFKETLPDVPSPLASSYMQEFMETNIVRHYREIGCEVPSGLSSVRMIRGRPYINVTLFQMLMVQLGGDPALVTEQMGGEAASSPPGATQLAPVRLARAAIMIEWRILRALWQTASWFPEMKRMGTDQTDTALQRLDERALLARMEALSQRVQACDVTFAIVSGVSQALRGLGAALARHVTAWRPLLNAATQGLGRIISAIQITRLAELAAIGRWEPQVKAYLLAEPWHPTEFRQALAGTQFLARFDQYLVEYGHRAIGESDVMTPRFAEIPDYVLGIMREQVRAAPSMSRAEQSVVRQAALTHIRRSFGWRVHEWLWFQAWHRVLQRYLELREANRHHLMHYLTGLRRILLTVGDKLVARGTLKAREDVFFLMTDEIRKTAADPTLDWKDVVAARRADRERLVGLAAPDTVTWRADLQRPRNSDVPVGPVSGVLLGMPISAGSAEGPVCLILSPDDFRKLRSGDILVAPVIDPGMAPLLGLAAGLIVEMGGTLSHGAIIAREYGIPAIANVPHITRLLKDGERVEVAADRGEVRRLS